MDLGCDLNFRAPLFSPTDTPGGPGPSPCPLPRQAQRHASTQAGRPGSVGEIDRAQVAAADADEQKIRSDRF